MPRPTPATAVVALGATLAAVAGGLLLAQGPTADAGAASTSSSAGLEKPVRATEASSSTDTDPLRPIPKSRARAVEPAVAAGAVAADAAAGAEEEGSVPAPTGAASGAQRTDSDTTEAAVTDAVHQATALENGVALPPLEAPTAVLQMIEAGNVIARSPYKWGGGHGRWLDNGYDCSGSVSFVLAAAGLLGGPLDSGHLAEWGKAGPGKHVTIYANAGHVWMTVAGLRFDTSGAKQTGSRWQNGMRPTSGFTVRHPPGL